MCLCVWAGGQAAEEGAADLTSGCTSSLGIWRARRNWCCRKKKPYFWTAFHRHGSVSMLPLGAFVFRRHRISQGGATNERASFLLPNELTHKAERIYNKEKKNRNKWKSFDIQLNLIHPVEWLKATSPDQPCEQCLPAPYSR